MPRTIRLECGRQYLYVYAARRPFSESSRRVAFINGILIWRRNRPVLAALPSQFAVPIMCDVESLLTDAPLRIRVDGLESRRSYAET